MKNDSQSNLIKQFFGFFLSTWLIALFSFVLTPVITRIIPPSDLGQIDVFVTYCNMFVYASTLGMHQSYMRFFNEASLEYKEHLLYAYSLKIASIGCLVTGIICAYHAKYFSIAILGEYSPYISISMIAFITSNVLLSIIKTRPRMIGNILDYTIISITISLLLKTGYLVYAILNNPSATIFIIAILYGIALCTYIIREHKIIFLKTSEIPKESKIAILKYAIPTIPIMFLSNINASLPKILLNRYWDSSIIGIYAGTLSVVAIINIMQGGINVFWTPFVFKNYSSKDLVIKVQEVISVSVVIFACLLILFQDAVFILLGTNYRAGKLFYPLLLVSPVFYTIGETVGIGINISKKTYINVFNSGFVLIINIILGYAIIPKYGNLGASISVTVSAVIMLLLKGAIGDKFYTMDFFSIRTLFPLTFFLAYAVLSSILSATYNNIRLITLLCILLFFIFLYRKKYTFIINKIFTYFLPVKNI